MRRTAEFAIAVLAVCLVTFSSVAAQVTTERYFTGLTEPVFLTALLFLLRAHVLV